VDSFADETSEADRRQTSAPPPAPPGRTGAPSAAPPAPPVPSGVPPVVVAPDRANLLASIRGVGGGAAKLRHVDDTSTPAPEAPRAETPSGAPADAGNLASALAAALTVRRAGTGDSDDDDSSDDEWDE
jgi:hypothetical protein